MQIFAVDLLPYAEYLDHLKEGQELPWPLPKRHSAAHASPQTAHLWQLAAHPQSTVSTHCFCSLSRREREQEALQPKVTAVASAAVRPRRCRVRTPRPAGSRCPASTGASGRPRAHLGRSVRGGSV